MGWAKPQITCNDVIRKRKCLNWEKCVSELVYFKHITDGGLRAKPPAAGGFRDLGAKPPAAGRFFEK